MASKMIDVMSTVNAQVVIRVPNLNFKRTWPKKGSVIKVPEEILDQAFYEPGIEYLFRNGILYIDDMEKKVYYGLEEEGTTEPTNVILLDEAETERLLFKVSKEEFKEELDKLSKDQVTELAFSAVEHECTDYDKNMLLQKRTGINVFRSVAEKKEEANKANE